MPKRLIDYLRGVSVFLLLAQQSSAIILYSGDNSANQTAPDAERTDIFNAVARVTNSTGGDTAGSAVHIRGKYLLTANHVLNRTHVTFDGVTFLLRDTSFTPIKIGTADMKLIKLVTDPELAETSLFTGTTGDTLVTATIIGWGVGRDPSINDSGSGPTNIWQWGNSSTFAKRWGTNQIDAFIPANTAPYNINYDTLITDLDRNTGDNEAAVAVYDSGSGIFVDDNGTWKLAGLTTLVTSNGSSTFSLSGDNNFFARIRSYASAIDVAIPDTSTYSDWKVDHSLYGTDANNDADTDFDGIGQLLEFAFGGDPNENDISILPSHTLVENGGDTYLELSVTRPIGLQGITYTPMTTTDLTSWPSDSIGIVDATPSAVDNGDGTETLTYRRTDAVANADSAFIRVDVSETP